MNKLKNSKIILVLSVLLLFLVIGSASAVDETGNETISTPENNGVDTLSQSVDDGVSAADSSKLVANDTNSNLLGLSNDDVLSADVGSFTDLYNDLNNNIKSNNQILLTKDYTFKSGDSNNINIIKSSITNLVIDGQGHTITGNNNNALYITFLKSSNITIKNINFKNMYNYNNPRIPTSLYPYNMDGYNAIIRFGSVIDSSIINCTFDYCRSPSGGAAIILTGYGSVCSNINMSYCNFSKCSSGAGGAIYTSGHNRGEGSADGRNVNHILIEHCYFEQNQQKSSGTRGSAMELNCQYATVSNCTFVNNYAYGAGAIGLFSTAGYATIENCSFIGNSALKAGAISAENAACLNTTIKDCYFEDNVARSGGGGAVLLNSQYANVTNCMFIHNTATNDGGAVGFTASKSSIDNCIFINNTATNNGGAVYFAGTNCNITNCNLTGNTAKEGGAVKFDGTDSTMTNCTYINNTATTDGGALCSKATGSTVAYCVFENNTAPVGKDFYGHKIPITFIGMTFTSLWLTNENYTDPDLPDADPLIIYGYGTDQFTPAIWDENALSFLKKNVHCTIYLVDTINNFTEKVLNISDLEIIGHDPKWNNGSSSGVVDMSDWNHRAFTVNASDVKFTNLTFKNANISGNGGALRIINDDVVIENCTFMNNTACNGSAISFEKGIVLIIEDSTFINNTALGNGTVYMYDDANSTMTLNSTFRDNTAYLGSAIYYAGPVWYYADGFTLTNLINANETNKDLYAGSLPYWENNTKIFTGFNESYWDRAKLCVMDVYVTLEAKLDGQTHNGTIDDPTDFDMAFQMVAPTGTIHFVNSSETWNMSKLYNKNEATNYKFGITFEGNNTTVTDYKFINSIYAYDVTMSGFNIINNDTGVEWKARNGIIINSSFTSKDHVAFNITGENLIICDSSFTGNGNGALYVDASGLVLSNCTFNNNNISSGVGSHIVLTENANNTSIIDSRFIKGNNTGVLVNAMGVSIVASNFTDNSGVNGGALILSNGTLVLSNNNFTYNKADGDGGAVYLENGTLKEALVNDFWHNRASNNGGALYTNIPVVMDGGVFFNNTAGVCGGGIYLNNTNNTLSNMEFNNNTAVNGSAIYVTKNNTLNVNNVQLKGNTHTDFTNIDTTVNHGSIYLSNYLSEGLFKDSGLVLGDLQDIWDGTYRLPVIYVNNTGTNKTGGASPETATSLDNALDHLIDGGKIIFTTNYDIDDMVNLTNRNLTLTSNNSSSIIRKGSTGKYLFINLK